MAEITELKKDLRSIQKEFRNDIQRLEDKYDDQIKSIYDSISTYDDIIKGNKIVLGVTGKNVSKGVKEKILIPVRKEFDESIDLVKKLTEKEDDFDEEEEEEIKEAKKLLEKREDIEDKIEIENIEMPKPVKKERKRPTIDDVFELVAKKGEINFRKAAIELNVHEIQVEEWAKTLKNHGLIEIDKSGMMRKKK